MPVVRISPNRQITYMTVGALTGPPQVHSVPVIVAPERKALGGCNSL